MLPSRFLLAVFAAGLCIATARAEDDDGKTPGWDPVWTAWTPKEKVKAAFPKQATESGRAVLDCFADKDGKLVDCKVIKEVPAGQGFGAAALSLVGYERIKTKDENGASVAGRPVRTAFSLLAPGDADPDWLKKPNVYQISAVFPKKAVAAGQSGQAQIKCQVTVEGFLEACKVLSESPAGYDFGGAALQLAPQLRMTPKIRGGKAVPGGEVTVPVNWPNVPLGVTSSASLVLDPPWSQVPSQAEINAVWPKQAAGLASGQVALRCALDRSGQLNGCAVISEIPAGKGFGKAAQTLSKSFRVAFDPADTKTLSKYEVDLPFRFRDPATPDARKLTRPRWIRTLTAAGMAEAYPEAAIKAGVVSGQGAVKCRVTATGELADCQAVSESPAGLDFGAATVKAISMMRMNPWTKEGDTVEGLVITLPVQFNWDGATATEPAKPTSRP